MKPTTEPIPTDEVHDLSSVTLASGRVVRCTYRRFYGSRYLVIHDVPLPPRRGMNLQIPAQMVGFFRDALSRLGPHGELLPADHDDGAADDGSDAAPVVRRAPTGRKRVQP